MDDALTISGSLPPDGPAPGWYNDPADPTRLRWWNGHTWTATTAVREGAAFGPYGSHSPYGSQGSQGAYGPFGTRSAAAHSDIDGLRVQAKRARLALAVAPVAFAVQYAASGSQFRRFAESWNDLEGLDGLNGSGGSAGASAASQLAGAVMIGVYVVFLMWFFSAATSAQALRIPSRRSPGWAIGGWFIPIVNLWFPYQSAKGLLPPGDPGLALVRRWWGWWIATQLMAFVVIGTAFGPRWLLAVGATVAVGVATAAAWSARAMIDTVVDTQARLTRGA